MLHQRRCLYFWKWSAIYHSKSRFICMFKGFKTSELWRLIRKTFYFWKSCIGFHYRVHFQSKRLWRFESRDCTSSHRETATNLRPCRRHRSISRSKKFIFGFFQITICFTFQLRTTLIEWSETICHIVDDGGGGVGVIVLFNNTQIA